MTIKPKKDRKITKSVLTKIQNGKFQKSRWYLVVTLIFSTILLFFAFRGVDWTQMLMVLQRGRLDYLALACLALSVSYFMRGLRWRVLLSSEKLIAPTKVFWATMVGYMGNNLLPARAGELIRTVMLGRNANISKSFILGTIFIERGMDVVVLVLISTVIVMSLEGMPGWLIDASWIMMILGLVALIGMFLAPHIEGLLSKVLTWLLPAGDLCTWAMSLLQQFLQGMRAFQNIGRVLSFVSLTAVIWLIDALVAITVAWALSLFLTFPQALFLIAILAFASIVPSTPGYVGVYQLVAVTVLVPFGFTQSEALAYIIAYQVMAYVVVLIGGFLGLWQLSVSPRSILRVAD